ncbi:MAG: PAS domain S-box protein [Pseudomonadota bacterium]
MPSTSTRKNIFLLAIPTIVVIIIATTLFWFFDRMQAANKMRNQTMLTITTAQELLVALTTSETAVRGYILTTEEDTLKPYLNTHEKVFNNLKLLREVSFTPAAIKQAEVIAPLVEEKMARLAYTVELKRKSEMDALTARLRSGAGSRLMDSIRTQLEEYTKLQNTLLAHYDSKHDMSMHVLFAFLIFASVFMLLFAQVFAYGIYRNIHQRLMNLMHHETKRSLETQEAMNQQLHLAYVTLQDSEKKLEVTLNSIGDAVIATDGEARVTLMNRVAEELIGCTQVSALGRPISEILQLRSGDKDLPIAIPVMDTLLHGTAKASKDTILIGHDGSNRNIADSCAPIRDHDDQVIGAVMVFRDVTEEYKSQQAVLDSTALLQTILATVVDGIVTFDVNTNLIATVNSAAEKMFGYSEAELVGKRFSAIVPELNEDEGSLSYYNASPDENTNGLVREVNGQLKNGNTFPLEIAVSEMRLGGQRYFTAALRNITARKNAEAVMRESEDRYRNLFNTIDEGFCTIEMIYENNTPVDFRFLEVNPSFEKQTGVADVMGKRVLELFPNFDSSYLDKYDKALSSGQPIRFIKDDRTLNRWFDIYACPENSKNNKNVILLFTDITERKQTEQALRESDERVRLATEATGVGIWEWDVAQRTMHWDAQMFRIYGVEPTADGFVEYDDWAEHLIRVDLRSEQPHKKHIAGEQSTREFRIKRSGEKRSRYIRSVEILRTNAQGEIESIVGTNLDITENKQTEKRLRENERHLRAVIDALPVAIYTTDAEGKLTHFNQTAVEFSGRVPQLGGDHWCLNMKLLRADGSVLPNELCPMAIALKEKRQILGAEAIAEKPDGSKIWFNAYPTPLYNAEGKLIGGINMLLDITERKRLDQVILENNIELKKAKHLAEKANLAKSNFLSNMSHELRTPLNAILGFAQLIEASNPPPTVNQKRNVDQILQAGWYLLNLINEILDLTLIESGKVSLSMESVLLTDLLRECQTMIEPQALNRNITLSFPTTDMPFKVNADQTRLKQILINLLSNAVKYNRENGKVTVTCFESSPRKLRICVEDTGEGLSPQNVAQLFQPFNRLGKENGPEEGTGIGLVMTKRLIELMGGKISVESTLGQGTVFWFDLEMTTQHQTIYSRDSEKNKVAVTHTKIGAAKRTLLYVEDNPANLMLVEEIMAARADIVLLSAEDGYKGIDLARLSQPDLILLDINLPGINGMEVLKILGKDSITKHIPVIALSANAVPRDIEKGLRAGFFRYLTKPIKINEFLNALDSALELGGKQPTKANEENII